MTVGACICACKLLVPNQELGNESNKVGDPLLNCTYNKFGKRNLHLSSSRIANEQNANYSSASVKQGTTVWRIWTNKSDGNIRSQRDETANELENYVSGIFTIFSVLAVLLM